MRTLIIVNTSIIQAHLESNTNIIDLSFILISQGHGNFDRPQSHRDLCSRPIFNIPFSIVVKEKQVQIKITQQVKQM